MAEVGYKVQLNEYGAISFVPKGNSMYPFLKNKGQSVLIRKGVENIKPYDAIFYQRLNGDYVLHRALEITDFGFICCGDSQFNTEKVKIEQVLGVMYGFNKGKKLVEVTDKHRAKVKKWYERKTYRKIRLKIFYFSIRVKNKLKRIFRKK